MVNVRLVEAVCAEEEVSVPVTVNVYVPAGVTPFEVEEPEEVLELLPQPKVESVATLIIPRARKSFNLRDRLPHKPKKRRPANAIPALVPGDAGCAGARPRDATGLDLTATIFAPFFAGDTLELAQAELVVAMVSVAVTGLVPVTVVLGRLTHTSESVEVLETLHAMVPV